MRMVAAALAVLAILPLVYSATPTVGSGAPTAQITFLFQNAFYRNNFNNMAALPPLANVTRLGTSGLLQEFETTAKDINIKMALVMPNQNAAASATSVLQIFSDIYGATPCNLAVKLLEPGHVEGVAGVNLPMLVRVFTYRMRGMDTLIKKAVSGGCEGVLQFETVSAYAPARS